MDFRELLTKLMLAVTTLSTLSIGHALHGRRNKAGETDTGKKIFGGGKAPSDQYRYNVWIRRNKSPVCGGSLVDRKWVLTAASCLMNDSRKKKYKVYIGDYNRESAFKPFKVKPSEFFIHPNFNRTTLEYNIAMIQLNKPAPKKSYIAIVQRLSNDVLDDDLINNGNCYMTGWGETRDGDSPKRLQVLPISVKDSATCSNLQNEATELCYSGSPGGACPTDEGNPVMCVIANIETQVGIHSKTLCTAQSTVATKLSAFKPWIDALLDLPESCGSLPKAFNGKYVADRKFVGDTATLVCKATYRPSTHTSCDTKLTCQEGGSWSSTVATCVPVCSSEGTSFMFGYLRNAFAEGNLYLYITAKRPTRVIIESPFLDSIFNVRVKRFGQVKLASSLAGVGDKEKSNKGINVWSEKPITVYIHSYRPGTGPSAEGSLISPESCLSNIYRVIAHDVGPDDTLQGAMMVVATTDDTEVAILTPSGEMTEQFVLNRSDTYHLLGRDFTGTIVYASKKVAVLAGHECGSVPNNWTEKCDHLVEQVPPVNALDLAYIIPGLVPRPDYSVRVVAVFDETEVSIWDNVGDLIINTVLQGDQSVFYNFTNSQTVAITANKHILVAQYGHGNSSDTLKFGDPSMVIMPGLSQFLNSYLVYTPTPPDLYNRNWVAIILSVCYDHDGLKLNGQPVVITDYITVPDVGTYAIFHVELSQANNTITHTDAMATFGVIQYGFNSLVQYAWIAGRSF